MSEWIPIDKATIDAKIQYEVTFSDGTCNVIGGLGLRNTPITEVLAVREYDPEPYMPPKPKARTWWIVERPSRVSDDAYRCMQVNCNMEPIEQVRVREVMIGDVDPDVVREVVAEMRSHEFSSWADAEAFRKWINKLEGKA